MPDRFKISSTFNVDSIKLSRSSSMRRVFFLVLVSALAAAIIFATRSVSTMAATANVARFEQELKDADLKFARGTTARRLEGWMNPFADDASTLQNGKVITGKAALREYYKKVFADNDFTLTWQPTKAEAAKDGTLGYTYGTYEAKKGASVSHGMYTTVWRRDNGQWRVVLDLGSS